MDDKQDALQELEKAFKYWFWATDHDFPDIGILVISLSRDGCDLQYMGSDPQAIVDWPALFQAILEKLAAREYSVQPNAEVIFPSQR